METYTRSLLEEERHGDVFTSFQGPKNYSENVLGWKWQGIRATRRLIEQDPRLGLLATIAREGRLVDDSEFSGFGYIFDEEGFLVARINKSDGIFELPYDAPLKKIILREAIFSRDSGRISKYTKLLNTSELPRIMLKRAKGEAEDSMSMQNGYHRYEVARNVRRESISSWVALTYGDSELLRLPVGKWEGNPNMVERFARAARITAQKTSQDVMRHLDETGQFEYRTQPELLVYAWDNTLAFQDSK